MDYAKALPATGGGLLVGGIVISQAWLLGVALAIVLVCAVTIRLVWRHNKSIDAV